MQDHFFAFWNVENLFAPEGYPEREPWIAAEMASQLKGWTQELFDTKIAQLTRIIRQMNGGMGPDILGVCEAENAFVLQTLADKMSSALNRNYAIVHYDSSEDNRGIDTAFIYDEDRYSVDPEHIYSHFVMRRTGTRDITQVTFTTAAGNMLVAMCNHWPARLGGTHETQGFRMTAAETLSYWHQRIWEVLGNETPIIAVGDFNDDPFDDSLRLYARATRERGDVERAQTAVRFYNLTYQYMRQQAVDRHGNDKMVHGTLYYGGNGNIFDQILVSKGLVIEEGPLHVVEESARMEIYPEMLDHRVSYGPIRFGLPKGKPTRYINTEGFSDHFPVSVIIREDV